MSDVKNSNITTKQQQQFSNKKATQKNVVLSISPLFLLYHFHNRLSDRELGLVPEQALLLGQIKNWYHCRPSYPKGSAGKAGEHHSPFSFFFLYFLLSKPSIFLTFQHFTFSFFCQKKKKKNVEPFFEKYFVRSTFQLFFLYSRSYPFR